MLRNVPFEIVTFIPNRRCEIPHAPRGASVGGDLPRRAPDAFRRRAVLVRSESRQVLGRPPGTTEVLTRRHSACASFARSEGARRRWPAESSTCERRRGQKAAGATAKQTRRRPRSRSGPSSAAMATVKWRRRRAGARSTPSSNRRSPKVAGSRPRGSGWPRSGPQLRERHAHVRLLLPDTAPGEAPGDRTMSESE